MKDDLLPVQPEKVDSFNRIKLFMGNEESGIILTNKEEAMLSRWIYANGLLKERKFREDDIIDKITGKFGVSRFTARNDISNARSLFVALIKDLKRYALIHHVEDLQILFQQKKNDKSFAPFLPKLADSLTRAIHALPEETPLQDVPAPVVVVNVVQGQNVAATMNLDEAIKAADDLIELEKKEADKDYTDFEELNNES